MGDPARPLIVLGATGDLTGRLLLPSLTHLTGAGPSCVVAVGAEEWGDARYAEWARTRLERHGTADDPAARSVLRSLHYVGGDVTDPHTLRAALRRAAERDDRPPVIYLALPHGLFAPTLAALEDVGVAEGTMIAVEKPFGTDGDDARQLNRLLHRLLPEPQVFRVDHFIAKRTVLNILGLRFANRLFEPLWNNQHVERVEIVYDETLGLEGRAGYYDEAGALRDMLQNHLLQLLALVVMDPPRALDATTLPSRKADALRAVRAVDPGAARRARYRGYVDEPGVDPARRTETYAEFTAYVDSWRWAGVPFRLRTGKALGAGRQEISVHFRPVPHSPFPGPDAEPNVLRIMLDTDGMSLLLDLNGEDDPFRLEPRTFEVTPTASRTPAYALVLESMLAGDSALSISDVEAEESWRIVAPVLAAWAADDAEPAEYPPGAVSPLG